LTGDLTYEHVAGRKPGSFCRSACDHRFVSQNDVPVVRANLKGWKFAARERELLDSASHKLPTWRMANQARKHLAGVVAELCERTPTPECRFVRELDARTANELASVNLGALVVRNTSGIMALIGCGHERESLGLGRVSLEALMRGRQVAGDVSGDAARKLLQGHRPGSLKSVAQRYGSKREVELLDRFAHADLLGLQVVATPRTNGIEADLQLLPQRGGIRPASQLLIAARYAVEMSVAMAEVFKVAVEIPAYLSGQLIHYKDNPLPVPL